MKIKIQIKHYITGSVLFEFEKEDNTVKDTVEEANLWGADLKGADLGGVILRGVNLRGANLRGANLRGANLWAANLWGADLKGADLRGVNLGGVILRGADLRGANLRGADLWAANLRGADLWAANLGGADLKGADLKGVNLGAANLGGAKNINSDQTDYWWHIHHEVLYEYLTEPIRARINYIKNHKPEEEIETRLRLLKPVLGTIPETEEGWEKLHKEECLDCPWDGKTIFPTDEK